MTESDSKHTLLYLDTATPLKTFLADLQSQPLTDIAIDTEGASFHRYVDRIYLLQLSTRTQSAIIDPLPFTRISKDPGHLEDPLQPLSGLGALLQNPAIQVVFHDADYDLRLLHQDYGWHPTNIFDTRIAAQLLGLKQVGLAALLETNFGVKLDKKHQRADWSMRPLTQEMLDYAAQDTRYLLDLKDIMKDKLLKAGRLSWAEEEFALLNGTQWEPEDPSQAYLRIKGARDLSRRELAILRELVPWRDSMAEKLDRATFRVMAPWALLDIAQKAPQSVGELAKIKGMPKGMLDRIGDDIIAAIRRGQAVAEDDLPRFPRGKRYEYEPDFDVKVDRGKIVREAAAVRLDMDPGILFSRERLEAVVRRKPRTLEELAEVPGVRRWQIEVLGVELLSAIN